MDNFLFVGMQKIARLSRDCIITEKIDGTNAQIYITDELEVFAGSKNRWLTLEQDNFGFARWVKDHEQELVIGLGAGRHFGEWWGKGIQRGYGLNERCFSLFNTERWNDIAVLPSCCYVVPILYEGPFDTEMIKTALLFLEKTGSHASPGFMNPEGIVIFHTAANVMFKKTIKDDEHGKEQKA